MSRVCDDTGDDPELALAPKNGDADVNSDGEKGEEAEFGGANGEGSVSPCESGESAMHGGDVSRRWKGGRPS